MIFLQCGLLSGMVFVMTQFYLIEDKIDKNFYISKNIRIGDHSITANIIFDSLDGCKPDKFTIIFMDKSRYKIRTIGKKELFLYIL